MDDNQDTRGAGEADMAAVTWLASTFESAFLSHYDDIHRTNPVETCCHAPLPEYCLVGVIGEDRPHCARCAECGGMVEFEKYDADGREAILSMYRGIPIVSV